MVSVDVKHHVYVYKFCEAVWPNGKALSRTARFLFDSPFCTKGGHCLAALSLTINETFKWLSSLLVLIQESF